MSSIDHAARRLGLGFALLSALTYGLIVLGALVRSHGAGLACPDWPLCFGEFVPRFDLRVAFEWSHRLVAGSISLLFLGLGVAALRREATRRAVGWLIGISAVVLVVQIILGALTVWQLLASWTVTSHLLTGNAFAVSLALIARGLYRADGTTRTAASVPAPLRFTVTFAGLLLLVQMTLGGLVASSYAGLACPEWPTCISGRWFVQFEGALATHQLHRLVAYTLVLAIAAAAWLGRGLPRLGPLLLTAAAGVLAQAAVGVANVLMRLPVEVTGLHSALAAALVLVLSFSLVESWERARTV